MKSGTCAVLFFLSQHGKVMENVKLPEGVGLNTIKMEYSNFHEVKVLMNKLGYPYDNNKSYHRNAVEFFNKTMSDDRLCELWDAMTPPIDK